MPEGDSIFRAARALNKALAGRTVTRFESVHPKLTRVDEDTPLRGRTVESVESRGKWLLMRFSGGLTLVTHLLMSGSWHIYRPGEAWQRSRSAMRVVIETGEYLAVGFNIPVAEFHDDASLARQPHLKTLGPDALGDSFDEQRVIANLQAHAEDEIGVALLDQRVLAGVGNVFKSEILFTCGVNPFSLVSTLPAEQLQRITSTARRLLLANVKDTSGGQITTYSTFRRTTGRTDPSARLWVYSRRGDPCRKCGAPIQSKKQQPGARTTFWCPRCQPLC